MYKILIPVNFTRSSKNAVRYAMRLAKNKKLKIILLHAFQTVPFNWDSSDPLLDEESRLLRQKSERKLDKIASKILDKTNIACETISYEGFAADAIIAHSVSLNPDLILIGTDILNAINHLVFGKITNKVISKINCNILIIPDDISKNPLKRIAFATYPNNDDSAELTYLTELSKTYQSQIHIVHLLPSDTTERTINYDLKKHELDVNFTYSENDFIFHNLLNPNLVEGLGLCIVENKIDTLVISKHEPTVLQRLFTSSVIKKPTYYTDIPIMILKDSNKEVLESSVSLEEISE
ncbi:MAG: universal stress protein [Bacteroidota bacterium]